MNELDGLRQSFDQSFTRESSGFDQFGDIEDLRLRAVVSDHLCQTAKAVKTNIEEARDHLNRVEGLVGPNGRAMPDPNRPEEEQRPGHISREMVGFFRASGSIADCLAALAIGVLRLPTSLMRAQGSVLTALDQFVIEDVEARERLDRLKSVVVATQQEFSPGWFEWCLEMRNSLVHRARQFNAWLPKYAPPIPKDRKLLLATRTPTSRLLRYEPHLRRTPWRPDMIVISEPSNESDWFREPATTTMIGLVGALEVLVESISHTLQAVWREIEDGSIQIPAPVDHWMETRLTDRQRSAEEFLGFEPTHQQVPLDGIVVNPGDAVRFGIAEDLRNAHLAD